MKQGKDKGKNNIVDFSESGSYINSALPAKYIKCKYKYKIQNIQIHKYTNTNTKYKLLSGSYINSC